MICSHNTGSTVPWCQQAACHVTANVRLVLLICRPAGRHAVAVSTPKGRVTPWHQRQLLLSPYNLQGGRHTVLCLSGVCVPRAAVCSGDCGAAVTAEEVGRSCYRLLIFQLSPSCRCNAKYTQLCTHVRTVPCVLMKGGADSVPLPARAAAGSTMLLFHLLMWEGLLARSGLDQRRQRAVCGNVPWRDGPQQGVQHLHSQSLLPTHTNLCNMPTVSLD